VSALAAGAGSAQAKKPAATERLTKCAAAATRRLISRACDLVIADFGLARQVPQQSDAPMTEQ
jgi:hypothetical protein